MIKFRRPFEFAMHFTSPNQLVLANPLPATEMRKIKIKAISAMLPDDTNDNNKVW
jgi:hypothetical protein